MHYFLLSRHKKQENNQQTMKCLSIRSDLQVSTSEKGKAGENTVGIIEEVKIHLSVY